MGERDPEIAAMEAVVGALQDLDEQARDRVLAYVSQRLDLAESAEQGVRVGKAARPKAAGLDPIVAPPIHDVRTLKEEKQPRSATEMAALVAYYLSELAGSAEQKREVTNADLEKYFKQAGYPLPEKIRYTLGNAVTAGYFDRVGGGRFKLNPVGHNLVAHSMPTGESRKTAGGRKAKAKPSSSAKKATESKSKPPSKGGRASKKKS